MVNQMSRNYRLTSFHNHYQPYAHSTAWDTKRRAAQPVFSPAESVKQQWKRQAGHGDPSLCHESFHHCHTVICHCSHFPCPKRPREEEAGNRLNAAQIRTSPEHPSVAIPETDEQPCTGPCQQLSKLYYSDTTEIQKPSLETARDDELEKHSPKRSGQAIKTNDWYQDNKQRLKSGNCSLNSSSIHCIASSKLQLKDIPVDTRQSREIPDPIGSSRDIIIGESLEDSDSECKITYVGKAKKSQESRGCAICANAHQKRLLSTVACQSLPGKESKSSNAALFDKHSECQLLTWNKDQKGRTKPVQSFDEFPKAYSSFPQQKQLDKAPRLNTNYGDSQQNEDTTQLSNEWSEVQRLQCTELGNATQKVQTNATSEGLEKTCGDYKDQRPGDSKFSPPCKFLSQETSDKDNTLSPLLTCSAESGIPTETAYDEDNLAENDWAGYGYDHNDLPRIVAVHTIVKDRQENTHRKELLGAKRLSSNERKEWKSLLGDLSSRGSDGYYEVEHNVHGHSKLSGARASQSNPRYSDPVYSMEIFGKRHYTYNSRVIV